MGTVVSFDVRHESRDAALLAIGRACALLHHDDRMFSTWQADSPVSRLRRGEIGVPEAPPEVHEVLELCQVMVAASKGWFDPWRMPGGVDPTGLVKGWATRRASEVLRSAGAGAAMVNAGGDIVTFGRPEPDRAWRVGVRDPRWTDRFTCIAILDGEGASLATSGTYERGAHVVDPFTARPATALLSATVTGPDLARADALATGLLAAGARGLEFVEAQGSYEAWVVLPDHATRSTAGFPLAD